MRLETCEGPLSGVKVLVELQTSHIGKGCDRETYSEKSLQKLCGKWRPTKTKKKKTNERGRRGAEKSSADGLCSEARRYSVRRERWKGDATPSRSVGVIRCSTYGVGRLAGSNYHVGGLKKKKKDGFVGRSRPDGVVSLKRSRRGVGQHRPPPCAQPVRKLDGVPPDRQRPRQRPHLQVRWAPGRQRPRPPGPPEPDGPVHRGHVDETRAQPGPEGREGNHTVQLRQDR